MINLFETYNQSSWDLHYSLIVSGYNNPTIAIRDDGFLPEDVTSAYLFFTGFEKIKGKPLYFNEVPIPEYWEISGNNIQAEIFEYNTRRGLIHYVTPEHLRLVKSVDWFDDQSRLRITDHYNKQGYRFAQTSYNQAQEPTFKTYFNQFDQEVIVENLTTGDVILNANGQIYMFPNRSEFVIHYLKEAGFELDRIFYNSLSTPFLVAYRLGLAGNDILFWQEDITDQVPGNMKLLLQSVGARATKIVVQNKPVYSKLLSLLPKEERTSVAFLGYHYPFKRQNTATKEALIMTNSDQLEGIITLIEQNKELHFHIGALTEMSAKLMQLGQYENVSLYPNISQEKVDDLFGTCSFYLDINHGVEILSASRVAFENRMVILAFYNTVHQQHYVAMENCFTSDSVSEMSQRLASLLSDIKLIDQALKLQEESASVETKERYQTVIE